MGFEEFLPEILQNQTTELSYKSELEKSENTGKVEKVNANQVYDVITSKKPDWQSIIYELIHTEQLDPWDIDIISLTNKYFQKIEEMEETDFYISSKVLLAAALLLRIKSEILLNIHIKSIDEILFGKKEQTKPKFESIEIDESELPILIPKTPLSRLKKVTLTELMDALNRAINTENRRIKKVVETERAKKLSRIDIQNINKIPLKHRIKSLYAKILTFLKKQNIHKTTYSNIVGNERNAKLSSFLPILHLDNLSKLWLEQETHLEEIYIYSYGYFESNKGQFLKNLEEDIEEMKKELEKEYSNETENSDTENYDNKTGLEKARAKFIEKKKLQEEVEQELIKELNLKNKISNENKILDKEEKIDGLTGFQDEQF